MKPPPHLPHAFLGAPNLTPARPAPTPPVPQGRQVVAFHIPKRAKTDVALLTLHRADGMANLNKAASALLPETGGIDLLPPLDAGTPWKLDARLGAPGRLLPGPGLTKRFRAQARLWLLFAGHAPEVTVLRFWLEPDPVFPLLWLLRPVA